MKVIKEGSEKLGSLKINDDSFAYNTPLGTTWNGWNDDEKEGNDDHSFNNFDKDLVKDKAHYHEEEEQNTCKLLKNPHKSRWFAKLEGLR
nr:hypothetical protein [Tanacetum cinerariifolium]